MLAFLSNPSETLISTKCFAFPFIYWTDKETLLCVMNALPLPPTLLRFPKDKTAGGSSLLALLFCSSVLKYQLAPLFHNIMDSMYILRAQYIKISFNGNLQKRHLTTSSQKWRNEV